MEQNQPNEGQILADVAELRDRFSHTQTLYKEVAALLFFRYGVTPTANKLYQLVRKGSMSAPAQALQTFWEDLRDKSRVRLDMADMPEELQTLTGDLLGRIWQEAMGHSKQQMLHYQTQADERVALALENAQEAQQALEAGQGALKSAQENIEQLNNQLQEAGQEQAALKQDLLHAKQRQNELETEKQLTQQELRRQGEQFAQDLERLQKAIELTEERAQANERRALLEIDKERSMQTRLRQQIEEIEQANKAQRQAHEQEQNKLQDQMLKLRQELGQEQGERRAMQAALDISHSLAKEMQGQLQLLRTRSALLERENEEARRTAQQLNQELEQAQAQQARPVRLKRQLIRNDPKP